MAKDGGSRDRGQEAPALFEPLEERTLLSAVAVGTPAIVRFTGAPAITAKMPTAPKLGKSVPAPPVLSVVAPKAPTLQSTSPTAPSVKAATPTPPKTGGAMPVSPLLTFRK